MSVVSHGFQKYKRLDPEWFSSYERFCHFDYCSATIRPIGVRLSHIVDDLSTTIPPSVKYLGGIAIWSARSVLGGDC